MFEKHFNPSLVESKHYPDWEASGVGSANPKSNGKPFVIMMPPPNVTGSLHMGHALTMTLQDILVRYHRMQGCDALWLPGTDHASIGVHLVLERQLETEGTSKRELGREKFLERAWAWKEESGSTITRQLRRLGALPDWSRERFTMDEGLSKAVTKVFVDLYKQKLIYKAKRLVNWDPKMKTGLSDLEVASVEIKGHMHYIRYPIEGETERFITVATTRPETMFGDTAIVVHPEDERYSDLIGKFAVLPIIGRPLPIIAEDSVDPEFGTGAMKVTPAHDFNDFALGQKHKLPLIQVIDLDAKMTGDIPAAYKGLDRFVARKKIVAELEALELLEKIEPHTHAVPHDEKSKKTILEPSLTDQWWCDAATLAVKANEAVESGETQFVPKQWENTFFSWSRNLQPWCISRQLWWGHQIPAWYGPDGHVFVEETEYEAMAVAEQHYGMKTKLTRDPDVLDTWFSSALWPFSTLGWPEKTPELDKYYPGSVLVTGFDIIFFWVLRMMLMGCHFMGKSPFKVVYMHGMVRDASGAKMSKTKGNVIDPLDTIDEYGADALRFTMAASAGQGRDIKLSQQRIEGYRNFATKLWNAARYCHMNGCAPRAGFDPARAKLPVNRWIVDILHKKLLGGFEAAMEAYRFNDAATVIYDFVWKDFCDWYLEFTKPLLTAGDANSKEEIQATTGYVLDIILQVLNPIMPFITEEIYESAGQRPINETLITKAWPEKKNFGFDKAAREMTWVCDVISEIRSVRADLNVPPAAQIPLVATETTEETKKWIEDNVELLQRMARLSSIEFASQSGKGAVRAVVEGAQLALPVADVIDLQAEKKRLEGEIAKLDGELKRIEAKLGNPEFVANAPEDIVAEQKERRNEFLAKRQKYEDALKAVA